MSNLFLMILSMAVFYLTGWNLMWDGELKFISDIFSGLSLGTIMFNDIHFNEVKYLISDKDYFFSNDILIIRFNELYYGLYNTNRFFNSTIIESMGLGFASISLIKSLDFQI